MSLWYFTFPQRMPIKKDCYVKVEADTFWQAREAITEIYGSAWGFQYDEIGFAGQAEKYNLTEIELGEYSDEL